MHRVIHIGFLTTVILLYFGCNNSDNKSIQNGTTSDIFDGQNIPIGEASVVCGVIKNLDVYPQIKNVTLEMPDFKGFENSHTTLIAPDGTFYFRIYPITTREISLNPVVNTVIVHPGDSIYIEKDFKDITNVRYSGDASSLNHNAHEFLGGYYLGRYRISHTSTPEEFKSYCIDYRNEAKEKLNDFITNHKTDNEFRQWANTKIDIDYYIALLQFRLVYKQQDDSSAATSKDYYDFINSLEMKFNKSVICTNYFRLIETYYNYYLAPSIIHKYKGEPTRNHKRDSLFIEEISRISNNNLFNQFVTSYFFNGLLNIHETDLFEENIVALNKIIKDPFLLSTLSERYKYVKDFTTNPSGLSNVMLGKTELPTGTNEFDLKFGIRRELISKLIHENQKKVIYIDFWAEWCPPCIPELIESKKLIERFQGKDIEFVYICFSDSTSAKQIIKEHTIPGTHFYLNPAENNFYQNNFGFQALPHYVLIDKTGTIVDFGTLIRPSYPGTIEKIDKLLNE